MKGEKLSVILSILSIVFAAILYYLSLCDSGIQDVKNFPFPFNTKLLSEFYPFFCAKKGQIAILTFIFLIILHIVFYFCIENKNKKWLQRFLQHIIEQNLGGGEYETRITIFGRKKGWRFVCQYICDSIGQKNMTKRLKCCPNPFKDYLVIYNRFSYPEERKSYTYFRAIHDEEVEPQSIVEKCYKTGKPVSVSTAYITNICLRKSLKQNPPAERHKVEQYMRDTGMKDYDKLCTLKRKANYIYAVPIRYEQKMWGVISFDNNLDGNVLNIEEKLKDLIGDYQKIIQFTIQLNQ